MLEGSTNLQTPRKIKRKRYIYNYLGYLEGLNAFYKREADDAQQGLNENQKFNLVRI